MTKFRSRYDYGDNNQYFSVTEQPSLTDQRYKNCCDLSRIVTVNGDKLFVENPVEFEQALRMSDYNSMYEDVSQYGSFFEVQSTLANATNIFNDLPSTVRAKYDNDVDKFLSAVGEYYNSVHTPSVTPTDGLSEEVKTSSDSTNVGEKP